MDNVFRISPRGGSVTILNVGDTLIDRYSVLRYLAAGGMQEVYVCFDNALRRDVVLKTPKKGISDRRFGRGAEMGARISHPCVATTFDYYEDAKITFLIEEYIEGKDLGERLESEFFYLDPALGAKTLHKIARALYEAHKANICHRDLKPSNIMTSNDASISSVKLTDFGIAKLAESEIAVEMERFDKDQSTLTSSGTLLGAVPYMAPECWGDWKSAGRPMDIWAFGCVAYHLLAGEPPFGSGRRAIRNVVDFENGNFHVPKPAHFGRHPNAATLENELWEMITSCIQAKPESRPDAADLIKKFDSICYPDSPRATGYINNFKVRFTEGGVGNFGFINSAGGSGFFHGTDFYGPDSPQAGQEVSFSTYSGDPHPRSAPVLRLR